MRMKVQVYNKVNKNQQEQKIINKLKKFNMKLEKY